MDSNEALVWMILIVMGFPCLTLMVMAVFGKDEQEDKPE